MLDVRPLRLTPLVDTVLPSPRMRLEDQRMLLILDIDETLLYATVSPLDRPEDFRLEDFFVYLRPHLGEFLSLCSSHFKHAIWTASSQN